jgi:hypothetical protein
VPGDVSLVGFDDIPTSDFVDPALTTVAGAKTQFGRAGIDLLMTLFQSGRSGARPAASCPPSSSSAHQPQPRRDSGSSTGASPEQELAGPPLRTSTEDPFQVLASTGQALSKGACGSGAQVGLRAASAIVLFGSGSYPLSNCFASSSPAWTR